MKSFSEYINESVLFNKINTSDLNKINGEFQSLTFGDRFTSLPLTKIDKILKKYNIVMLDDDGTEWEGLLSGNKGKEKLHLGYELSKNGATYSIFKNTYLNIRWEKDSSNKYVVFVNVGK